MLKKMNKSFPNGHLLQYKYKRIDTNTQRQLAKWQSTQRVTDATSTLERIGHT